MAQAVHVESVDRALVGQPSHLAQHRVDLLKREIIEFYRNYRVTHHLIELRNLVTVAELIVRSALQRRESRGLHYTLDFPQTDATAQPTVLTPGS